MTKQELLYLTGSSLRRITAADLADARTDSQRAANYIITTAEGWEYYSERATTDDIINAITWSKERAKLNSMCVSCGQLGKDCAGTTCQSWTGCIYRKAI